MESSTQTTEALTADIDELIQRLGSRRSAERKLLETALRRLGLEAVEPLLAIIKQQTLYLQKRMRLSRLAHIVAITTLLTWLVLPHTPPNGHLVSLHTLRLLLGWYNVSWYSCRFFAEEFWLLGNRQYRTAVNIVANSEDLRIIGLLAPLSEQSSAAKNILTRLLPRLKATDADLLNAPQRMFLQKQLRQNTRRLVCLPDRGEELSLAILKALEQVGEADALLYVEQVAKTTKSAKVRDAALACLPYLTQRAEAERAANTFLRASGAADVPGTTLLRAAQADSPMEPQMLLRAGTRENARSSGHELPS